MNTQNKPDREEVIEAFREYQKVLSSRTLLTPIECKSLDVWLDSALQLLEQDGEDGKRLETLLECYEAIACQNRCGCLHPACKNCQRDQDLDEAKSAMASTSTTEEESA